MKHWLTLPLLLLVIFAAALPVIAADPGDMVTSTVAASAPLFGGYAALVALFAPVLGMLTNMWWNWRGKTLDDRAARRLNRLRDLCISGIALAQEMKAKNTEIALSGAARLDIATNYVLKNAADFGVDEITDEIHSLLARLPGVGATGDKAI